MRFKARIINIETGDRKIIKISKHCVIYFQAEDAALEKCPDGWQVVHVWSYKR